MFKIMTALFLLACASASAQLRVGVVRINQLFERHPEKISYGLEAQKKIAAISTDQRKKDLDAKVVELQKIDEDARALLKILNDPQNETEKQESKVKFDAVMVERQKLIADYKSAQQTLEEFSAAENKKLNQEMARKMRSILDGITLKIQEEAKIRDLDYVFEVSGSTSTGITAIPFVNEKAVIDLTPDLLKNQEAETSKTEVVPSLPE
jgi:outer membrane protein